MPGESFVPKTASTGWAEASLCLLPFMDRVDARLSPSVLGAGGLCGPTAPLTARLDDVRVEPDPACP